MIKYYPFELHTHSLHSDGAMTPTELAEYIKSSGLAGFALTDHNTSTGFAEAASAGEKLGLSVIKGMEWTTFYGHITVLGTPNVDWRTVSPQTVSAKALEVRAQGGAVGIAHPYRVGFPVCTGGSDDWGLEDYGAFSHYEIWSYENPAFDAGNALALKKYRQIVKLNRLAAVYGRDLHERSGGIFASTYLGVEGAPDPQKAIKAVLLGRTYISTGVNADIYLTGAGGARAELGDSVPAGSYTLTVKINGGSPDALSLYDGSEEIYLPVNGEFTSSVSVKPPYLQVCLGKNEDGVIRNSLIATPFFCV